MVPEISVIMPVYNKEKYVRAALASVLEQPFQDIEVIAINDGSTDASGAVLREIAASDVRVRVVEIPNGGVSNARNVGLSHAKGKWIQFLDADDLLEPDYLVQAMNVLKVHPAEILFSGFTMVNECNRPVKEVCLTETGMKNQAELCRCFIENQSKNGFFGYISNKIFLRSIWESSSAQFPVGTTLAEDLHFYARLYPSIEKAYFWNGKSFRYLQTETNYINNTKIDYYSQLRIQLDIRRWYRESGLYDTYQRILDSRVAAYAAYMLFDANEEQANISDAFCVLRENTEVMACIRPEYMTGFYRNILRFLQKGNLRGLQRWFAVRNGVRALYRKVKGHDKLLHL